MYAFAGKPAGTAKALHDIRTLFRPTLDGLPGNDDLGGLSAFHVFSALGFGPVTPGAPFHVIGSPVFEAVTLRPAGAAYTFRVEAPGAGLTAPYVQSASIRGKAIDRPWFHERMVNRKGGVLRLEMGSEPSDWATGTGGDARPPSASTHPLTAFGCR
jgi:putative alpha-1,2-mannosidase